MLNVKSKNGKKMTYGEALALKSTKPQTFIFEDEIFIVVISPSLEKDRKKYLAAAQQNAIENVDPRDYSTNGKYRVEGLMQKAY